MAPQVAAAVAAATVRLRVVEAVCAVGEEESFTVIETEAVPTELAAGEPLIAPVLLIVSPLGSPVAL
jgi:hypothetical protein